MSDPIAGGLFAQRFLVEARIATGGMSAIFRAIDQRTGRPVALKLYGMGMALTELGVWTRGEEVRSAIRSRRARSRSAIDSGSENAYAPR